MKTFIYFYILYQTLFLNLAYAAPKELEILAQESIRFVISELSRNFVSENAIPLSLEYTNDKNVICSNNNNKIIISNYKCNNKNTIMMYDYPVFFGYYKYSGMFNPNVPYSQNISDIFNYSNIVITKYNTDKENQLINNLLSKANINHLSSNIIKTKNDINNINIVIAGKGFGITNSSSIYPYKKNTTIINKIHDNEYLKPYYLYTNNTNDTHKYLFIKYLLNKNNYDIINKYGFLSINKNAK